MPNAGAEPAVTRFANDLAALIGGRGSQDRLGIAVSGGPDSMALLWLAHRACPDRVEAATVDHGLRPAARDEAEMVAGWCREAGVPHTILTPPKPISGSIQSAARTERYRLLEQWRTERGLAWLLTAHHADDQLETMLMRLNRSSGVAGLAGIRTCNGVVLRPLLGWRRSELIEITDMAELPYVHDPSNADSRFDRAALRARLSGVDWLDPAAFSRSAAACADADEALQWMVGVLVERHVHRRGEHAIVLDRHDFPREILRRLILRMLAMLHPDAPVPRGDSVDQAIVQLSRGKRMTIGDGLLTGGACWTLEPAPPRAGR